MLHRLIILVFVSIVFADVANVRAADGPIDPKSGAKWHVLFSKERWYTSQKATETVFRGKLEAVPNADAPSTLQRTAYYRLGKRTLYTAAKRSPALDRLVGKQVEFRGKAVDFRLEGQAVSEIWPAAVRLAKEAGGDGDSQIIRQISGFTTPRQRQPGFRRTKPTVIETEKKLAEVFGEAGAAKIARQVDLTAQTLVFFQWSGSGQDKLTYQVEGSEAKSSVVFSFQPGRTRDLRPHARLYTIRKGTTWKVAD